MQGQGQGLKIKSSGCKPLNQKSHFRYALLPILDASSANMFRFSVMMPLVSWPTAYLLPSGNLAWQHKTHRSHPFINDMCQSEKWKAYSIVNPKMDTIVNYHYVRSVRSGFYVSISLGPKSHLLWSYEALSLSEAWAKGFGGTPWDHGVYHHPRQKICWGWSSGPHPIKLYYSIIYIVYNQQYWNTDELMRIVVVNSSITARQNRWVLGVQGVHSDQCSRFNVNFKCIYI